MLRRSFLMLCMVFSGVRPDVAVAESPLRWSLAPEGGIIWNVAEGDAHSDFIEMNGEQVGVVVRFGVDANRLLSVSPDVVWPLLRFRPNLTGSEWRIAFGEDSHLDQDDRFSQGLFPAMSLKGDEAGIRLSSRTLGRVRFAGILTFDGVAHFEDGSSLGFERTIFPSIDRAAVIDTTLLTNRAHEPLTLLVDDFLQTRKTDAERGVYGAYAMRERVMGAGAHPLKPGDSIRVSVIREAHKEGEALAQLDVEQQLRAREGRMTQVQQEMTLETPDPMLSTAFALAKWHATESLFRTKSGLLHSPGGGLRYYAAIWANDEAEYANPFFGMLGDPRATEAAINSFRLFARFINATHRPIPSSIVSEGDEVWQGAGDRGDMAMIAYGASRFALANGDRRVAEELWPLITWCLDYLESRITREGVVASDSDELEGRFPSGKANLNTSSLYFDALRSAAFLGSDLGKSPARLAEYVARAAKMRSAIERYFGATIDGYRTYRYYDRADLVASDLPEQAVLAREPDVLRSWIATPLTMGIFDRARGTLDALFSSNLWSANGARTAEGQDTYWDRSTLYTLRGAFAAADTERALAALSEYTRRRLLGDHVPYPVEALPDGMQLSAESALYCRLFSEGLFGIRPTGLHSFDLTPRLPKGWSSMALKHVHAFGSAFDLEVRPVHAGKLQVLVTELGEPGRVYEFGVGTTQKIRLAANQLCEERRSCRSREATSSRGGSE